MGPASPSARTVQAVGKRVRELPGRAREAGKPWTSHVMQGAPRCVFRPWLVPRRSREDADTPSERCGPFGAKRAKPAERF